MNNVLLSCKLSYIILLLLESKSNFIKSELQFCHNGSFHVIRSLDCQGGIVFPRPIKVECLQFMKQPNIKSAHLELSQNYCADNKEFYPVEVYQWNETYPLLYSDRYDYKQLNHFIFRIEDYKDSGNENTQINNDFYDVHIDCFTLNCPKLDASNQYKEYTEFYHDGVLRPPPENDVKYQREQTLDLFSHIMADDTEYKFTEKAILENDVIPKNELRIFKLFAKCVMTMSKYCNPFVKIDFLQQIFKAIVYLVKQTADPMIDIGIGEYKIIDASLKRCFQHGINRFKMKAKSCGKKAKVSSIDFEWDKFDWKYKATSRSFRWGLYDPIVEAGWNVVDFIHGFCFESFAGYINHLHVFQVALESIFTRKRIVDRWTTPIKLKKESFWNNVLQTPNATIAMHNLDACVMAGYSEAPFMFRLERPFVNEKNSKKKLFEMPPGGYYQARKGTPRQNMREFWQRYLLTDTVQNRIKSMGGVCFETEEEGEKFLKGYKASKCKPDFPLPDSPTADSGKIYIDGDTTNQQENPNFHLKSKYSYYYDENDSAYD